MYVLVTLLKNFKGEISSIINIGKNRPMCVCVCVWCRCICVMNLCLCFSFSLTHTCTHTHQHTKGVPSKDRVGGPSYACAGNIRWKSPTCSFFPRVQEMSNQRSHQHFTKKWGGGPSPPAPPVCDAYVHTFSLTELKYQHNV